MVRFLYPIVFGIILGALTTWSIIFKIQILLGTIIALIGWWLKTLYEKWGAEKAAISSLLIIYSENSNITNVLENTFNELEQSLKSSIRSIGTGELNIYNFPGVIYLREVEDNYIKPLRNLLLLNTVLQSGITIKRYNLVIKHLWDGYQTTLENIQNSSALGTEATSRMSEILDAITHFKENDLKNLKSIILKTASHLNCAGEKINQSSFSSITSITIYKYNESDVKTELERLEAELKSKE